MNKLFLLLIAFLFFFCSGAQEPKRKESGAAKPDRTTDSIFKTLNRMKRDTTYLNALIEISLKMQRTHPPDETMPYAYAARKLADSLVLLPAYKDVHSFRKKRARCYNILGVLHVMNANLEAAVGFYRQALALREEINDSEGIAGSLNNLGAVSILSGDYVSGMDYELRSLKICEESRDSVGLGYAYFNLGRVKLALYELPAALQYGQKCLKIRENLKDEIGISECLSSLGEVYRRMEKMDESLNCHLRSVTISEKLGLLAQTGHSYNNIAVNYMNRSYFDSALTYYKNAIDMYRKAGDGVNLARTHSNISRVYHLKKDFKTTKKLILLNLDSLIKYRQVNLMEEDYSILAACDSALGNFKEALRYARLHTKLRTENLNVERIKKTTELERKYEVSKKEAENKTLVQQNEIQQMEIRRGRQITVMIVSGSLLVLLTLILLIRQNKLKSDKEARQLEQKLLRSQMNPHFIFNSLQAIQNFMLKRDGKEAIRYLNSFASITRDVLENSRLELISVRKEIALLENYLELQKLRFDARFEYRLSMDEYIEKSELRVPPMLSQPFIENAIEHGMNDIESGGKIEIAFSVRDNYLCLDISDNGKGMRTDKQDTLQKRTSLAIEITKARIALMNKGQRKEASFTISDAFPLHPERKGVKVSFKIPLEFLA